MRRRIGDDRKTRVVGDVEPLVRVGRPRIGGLDAFHLRSQFRNRRRPETERAIDVDPGATRMRASHDGLERIARAGADVARQIGLDRLHMMQAGCQ